MDGSHKHTSYGTPHLAVGRSVEGREVLTHVPLSQAEPDASVTRGMVDYISTYQNLNDQMDDEQKEGFRRYMQTGDGVAEIADDGETLTFVFPDQPISVQSVEDAVRLREERELNLGD